jgi:protein O-mannosyl-transferase
MRLNFDPDLAVRDAIDVAWLAKLAVIVAVFAFATQQLRRRPWVGFAILWFALALLPTHSLLARLELANDRQLYLAMVGPALAIGVVLASMRARALGVAAAVGLGLILGFATFVRVSDYSTESRLWSATARASPGNARAWNNLGHALAAQGDADGARSAYEKALAIDPESPRARGNLDALRR